MNPFQLKTPAIFSADKCDCVTDSLTLHKWQQYFICMSIALHDQIACFETFLLKLASKMVVGLQLDTVNVTDSAIFHPLHDLISSLDFNSH